MNAAVYGAGVSFLDRLPASSSAALSAAGRIRRYPKGSLVCAEGDPATEVVIIRSGTVKVLVTALSGREVVLDVMEDGALLGELSAIDGSPRSATAIALTQLEVLAIPQSAFRRVLDEDTALARRLLDLLAERMRASDRRQLELATGDALGRLCQRLVSLAQRNGQRFANGAVEVTTPVSQQDLAAWAGLSREAVVKGFYALRRLEWIETNGRQITILDIDAVTRRAAT